MTMDAFLPIPMREARGRKSSEEQAQSVPVPIAAGDKARRPSPASMAGLNPKAGEFFSANARTAAPEPGLPKKEYKSKFGPNAVVETGVRAPPLPPPPLPRAATTVLSVNPLTHCE